jgi:membrane fusion protein, copper/silver efflux system
MKNRQITGALKIAIKYLVVALFFATTIVACKQKPQQVNKEQSKFYYTCSMHPQVHLDHDGNCPICGMKLIKVEVTGDNERMAGDKITLTASQIQLAGIETDTVKEQNIGSEKTLTGTVTTNENQAEQMSARIPGRIQQLFVRTVGEKISAGQPIYSIYSEDLMEAEKEYLLAQQQQKVLNNPDVDHKQLIAAAENKLKLWGVTATQIKSLSASGKASATVTVMSKISGTVSDILIHEGDYVTEGMPILKTQSLNNLWVEAQLYAAEAGTYRENDQVSVSFPDLGNQVIHGKVEFINPELSDASKVDLVRISIPNPQGLIKPGMLAYISVATGKQQSLAIPVTAIMSGGSGDKVWVKNADGSFSPKMVRLGTGNQTFVPVLAGLNGGDVVVSNGVYLLNSEAIFKNGNNQMGGMKM